MLSNGNPFKFAYFYGKGKLEWVVICILFSLLDVLVSILTPIVFKVVVDEVTTSNKHEGLFIYVAIIAVLLLIGTINVYMRKLSSSIFANYTTKNLRNRTTQHIQNVSYPSLKKHHSGDLVSRLNEDTDLFKNFLIELSDFLYQPLIFVCALVYGFILSWKLLLATFLVLIVAMTLNSLVSGKLSSLSSNLQTKLAKANTLIQDTIRGIYVVKAFNLQGEFQNSYTSRQKEVYDTEIDVVKRKLLLTAITTLLFVVPMLVINLYGGRLAFIGDMTLGEFTAFLAIISYLTTPVSRIMSLVSSFKIAIGGTERINEILTYSLEDDYSSGKVFLSNSGTDSILEFKNISFSYCSDEKEILKGISFKVNKGKKLALVGASGSGKSTVLNLICGFETTQMGEMKIFGKDIKEIGLLQLRNQIAMVTQDTYLYPKTVMENIAFGKKGSTKDEVIGAAKKANAHEFILKLPNGYETVLEEGGSNLSGGQKQRLAIARAILKDAPILLLDEPTSALDSKSERLIDEAIKAIAADKSVIIVAHRLSTIKDADEIVVLEKGTIAQRGTHEQLLQLGGIYKEMYLKQEDTSDLEVKRGA